MVSKWRWGNGVSAPGWTRDASAAPQGRAGERVSPRYIALLGLKAQASPVVPPPPRVFYEGVCRREGD